jgi:hypothetical protein
MKYKEIDGVLLLHVIKQRDGEIAKEVAGLLIFVVDFVFCGVTKSYFYNQKKQEKYRKLAVMLYI